MTSVLFAGSGAVSAAAVAALPGAVAGHIASRHPTGPVEVRRPRRFRSATTHTIEPMSYAEAAAADWDLIVLTTRPGETDPAVLDFATAFAPLVATTSQVPGDLGALAARAGAAVLLAPAFLSDAASRDPLRVTAWYPGRRLFVAAGEPAHVDAATALLAGAATPGTEESVLTGAARTMPYLAELVVAHGDWNALNHNLRRPAAAAAEALGALTGRAHRVPPAVQARVALAALSALAPFDFPAYAAQHFTRHAGQTLAMLDAWRAAATTPTPTLDELRHDLAETIA